MKRRNKLWQLGHPGSITYFIYDYLRQTLNHHLAKYISNSLNKIARPKILEAGSGPAFATYLMAHQMRNALCVAADIDIQALRQARRNDVLLPVVVADIYHLPFDQNSFDLVWNSSTIEHLDQAQKALFEMVRVSSCFVFFGVPYAYGPLGFQKFIQHTKLGNWIGTVFTRPEIEKKLYEVNIEPKHHILYFFSFFIGIFGEKISKIQRHFKRLETDKH